NDTVTITSSDVNSVLATNAALVSGTKNFSVTLKPAGSATVSSSDTTHPGIPGNTSSAIPVNAGAFTKMQILVPGETAAPGTANGKGGTPLAQVAGTAFTVSISAVDANWNVVPTVTDIMVLSS